MLACLARVHRASVARRTRVIVVVGSFGKTTTSRAVATALGRDPDRLKDNYASFLAAALLSIRPRDRHAVIEVGIDRVGQMSRYARIVRPDVAVVTCIGSEHNRSLRDFEVTRTEKAAMVRALGPSGLAVLNGDDANVRWMKTQTRAVVRTFGFDQHNDVRATDVAIEWPHGTGFTLHADGMRQRTRVRLLGRHMVYSVLAAVTVALAEGFGLDQSLARIASLAPTPGRLEPVQLSNGAFLLRDDFKSPLETIESALDVLAEIPADRRMVVLGDVEEPPGSQGPIYGQLGERLASLSSRSVLVTSDFRRYASGARRAGLATDGLIDAKADLVKAADAIGADLRGGDVVLIKGRSTQRLERIALALAGHRVRCELKSCDASVTRCENCPMLARGWGGLRAVF
jgi:UDP-N-acetylmuramoyl-tripeptide--D-alanyl-D-alanine ligase